MSIADLRDAIDRELAFRTLKGNNLSEPRTAALALAANGGLRAMVARHLKPGMSLQWDGRSFLVEKVESRMVLFELPRQSASLVDLTEALLKGRVRDP